MNLHCHDEKDAHNNNPCGTYSNHWALGGQFLLYSFLLVVTWSLNCMFRRFATFCLFQLHGSCKKEQLHHL